MCLPSVLAAANAPIGSNASVPSPFVGLALFGRGVRTGLFLGFLGLSGSPLLPSFGRGGCRDASNISMWSRKLLSDVRELECARYVPSAAVLLSFFGGGGGLFAFAVMLGGGST